MDRDGHDFLDALAEFPPQSFEGNFCRISRRLDLGTLLSASELNCLYQAAFKATLCKIAFNGLGNSGPGVEPELEYFRSKLETEFINARYAFYTTPGWAGLAAEVRSSVERLFLRVEVAEGNFGF